MAENRRRGHVVQVWAVMAIQFEAGHLRRIITPCRISSEGY